ncbi:hypothetical protein RCL_jg7810.t1 [Rhizophagus clarus]|uniref:Uncharacterized protein n=1 Tax=Rhizophagus clarus TaxID=94130 RepID=A0A8H3MFI6_9GLOM|nr:hypothetical protein RCL_jg7810.t1 [Rhizophagus clarus]
MYSVLPAGHDLKTPETDADFEKELEEEEFRKSQGVKYWEKKHGIQKAKVAKEENRERTDNEIEEMLKAMAI